MEELKKRKIFNPDGDKELSKRRMIGGNPTGLNDFNNVKYGWINEWYRQAMNNFWIPEEINLNQDVKDYRNKLTPQEKKAYDKILSFLTFLDSVQTANLPNVADYITANEVNLCLNIQTFQEAVHCYAEGTEILTSEGWKDFKDINKKTLVAQYDPSNKKVSFGEPDEIISSKYTGSMILVNNNFQQLCVTRNHRMLVYNSDTNTYNPNTTMYNLYHNRDKSYFYKYINPNNNIYYENETVIYILNKLFKSIPENLKQFYNNCLINCDINKNKNINDMSNKIFIDDYSQLNFIKFESIVKKLYDYEYNIDCKDLLDYMSLYFNFSLLQNNNKLKIINSNTNKYFYNINDFQYKSCENVNVYCVTVSSGYVIVRYNKIPTISGNSQSYSYMLDSICSPEERNAIIYQWKDDEHLLKRNSYIGNIYNDFQNDKSIYQFLRTCIANYVLEGIYFYSGFMFFYNLARNNKMPGSAQEIRYINRDENTHLWLFRNILRELQKEHPEYFTEENKTEFKALIKEGAEQEIAWGKYVLGNEIEGLTETMVESYIKYIANLRSNDLGFGIIYEGFEKEPESMQWVNHFSNPNMVKTDFFEGKPTAYSKSSAIKDDL